MLGGIGWGKSCVRLEGFGMGSWGVSVCVAVGVSSSGRRHIFLG